MKQLGLGARVVPQRDSWRNPHFELTAGRPRRRRLRLDAPIRATIKKAAAATLSRRRSSDARAGATSALEVLILATVLSGRAMFERLAKRAPSARFHVFQGTKDWNTPIEPVRALEAWNVSQGHLDITFHYYQGGHQGSDDARAEIAQLLAAIVSE